MKRKLMMLCIAILLCSVLYSQKAIAQDGKTKITFSGSNFFESRYGMKPRKHGFYEEHDFFWDGEYRIQPWYYIKNIFDMNIGINKFYFRGRFLVDAPSMGYHPENSYWYRELFAQRTFGYSSDILNINVGHFKTEFGRGISISLKEDPLVELSNLLDGVHLMSELDFGTIKAFVGRNLGEENQNVDFLEDFSVGDNILGLNGEFFPFSYIDVLSIMSSSSIGAGVLNFRTDVSELIDSIDIDSAIVNNDTSKIVEDTTHYYKQLRTNIIVPSWLVNLSIGPVNFYSEFALAYTRKYDYVDSLNKEVVVLKNKSYGAFIELSGSIGNFYLRSEYKNYFYGRNLDNTTNGISSVAGNKLATYTDAPWARYKHLWHLLAKRTLLPKLEDEIGYNAEITWTPTERTQVLVTANFGGPHVINTEDSVNAENTKYSLFKFETEKKSAFGIEGSYYDIYAELKQKIGEKLDLTIGLDYGQMDPKHTNILYRTLAGKLDIGPFNEKHNFGVQGEMQLNTYTHYAEKNYDALRVWIKKYYEDGEFNPNDLTGDKPEKMHKYYKRIDKEKRNKREDLAIDWLAELNYNFSSIFRVHGCIELETLIGSKYEENGKVYLYDDLVVDGLIEKKSRLFVNGGISVTPVPKHSFILEGGSFSRVKICNMGVCTIIPAFKGIKFTIKSTL